LRKALGKGLSQLISEQAAGSVLEVPLDSIIPNSRQPRSYFDIAALDELADSIREHGILQPLVVRPIQEGRYELIAGERRLRAASIAGLRTVPALVRSADDQKLLELALIENLQREDISAIESARAYQQLVDRFGLTQEEIAKRVGKSRATVANSMRLLKLPEPAQDSIEQGEATEGQLRPILALRDKESQLEAYRHIVDRGLSAREAEDYVRQLQRRKPRTRTPRGGDGSVEQSRIEEALRNRLSTSVRLTGTSNSGKIIIDYFSEDDLARILEIMEVELD
jgi:ParB family chromosome partitioning protein